MQNADEILREKNGRNMCDKEDWIAMSEVLTPVMLQTLVLLDGTPCHWASGFRNFAWSYRFHIQGEEGREFIIIGLNWLRTLWHKIVIEHLMCSGVQRYHQQQFYFVNFRDVGA
jgi:hypothetical protein